MGGLCSRSSAKHPKEEVNRPATSDAIGEGHSSGAEVGAAQGTTSLDEPIRDSEGRGGASSPSAYGAAPSSSARQSKSNGPLSSPGDVVLVSQRNPDRDEGQVSDELVTAASTTTTSTPTTPNAFFGDCPFPSQRGSKYERYFPAAHDAGMQLGADKYEGVGGSPFSEVPSADLHSFASSRSADPDRTARRDGKAALVLARMQSNPLNFEDEDTAITEMASTAFATPMELRDVDEGRSAPYRRSSTSTSLVSNGSVTSKRPHGYRYYNSNALEAGVCPLPSPQLHSPPLTMPSALSVTSDGASHHADQRSPQSMPQPPGRGRGNAITVTNVRTNRQQPLARFPSNATTMTVGTPLSRQSSLAATEKFYSCQNYSEAFLSEGRGRPYLKSPSTATDADELRLLLSRPELSTTSSPGEHIFYSCRSGYPQSTDSRSLTPSAARGASDASARIGVAVALRGTGRPLVGREGASLPPRSPISTPRGAAPRCITPVAQHLRLQAQSGQRFGAEPTALSDSLFLAPGSGGEVLLDLSSPSSSSSDSRRRPFDALEEDATADPRGGDRTSRPGASGHRSSNNGRTQEHSVTRDASPSQRDPPKRKRPGLGKASTTATDTAAAHGNGAGAGIVGKPASRVSTVPKKASAPPRIDLDSLDSSCVLLSSSSNPSKPDTTYAIDDEGAEEIVSVGRPTQPPMLPAAVSDGATDRRRSCTHSSPTTDASSSQQSFCVPDVSTDSSVGRRHRPRPTQPPPRRLRKTSTAAATEKRMGRTVVSDNGRGGRAVANADSNPSPVVSAGTQPSPSVAHGTPKRRSSGAAVQTTPRRLGVGRGVRAVPRVAHDGVRGAPPTSLGTGRPLIDATASPFNHEAGSAGVSSGAAAAVRNAARGRVLQPAATRGGSAKGASPGVSKLSKTADSSRSAAAMAQGSPDAETAEPVVKYALPVGDAVGATANDAPTREVSELTKNRDAAKQTAVRPSSSPPPPPSWSGSEGAGVPQARPYRVSPDLSVRTALTSAAESDFLQPFSETQLVAHLRMAATDAEDLHATQPLGVVTPSLDSDSDVSDHLDSISQRLEEARRTAYPAWSETRNGTARQKMIPTDTKGKPLRTAAAEDGDGVEYASPPERLPPNFSPSLSLSSSSTSASALLVGSVPSPPFIPSPSSASRAVASHRTVVE